MKNADKRSVMYPFACALILAVAFGILWLLLVSWVEISFINAGPGGRGNWADQERLVVRSDGTILIELTHWGKSPQATIVYHDLKGAEQSSPERSDLLPWVSIAREMWHEDDNDNAANWALRIKQFIDDRDPNANWFFVHDGNAKGAGYFVGYDRESRQRIGFIGLSAGPEPVPRAERIPVTAFRMLNQWNWSSSPNWARLDSSWRPVFHAGRFDLPSRFVYIPDGKQLREVDLNARTIATVFEAPQPIESIGVPIAIWSGGEPVREQPILVRTRQQIIALDRQHKVVRRFTIPEEIDPKGWTTCYELAGGQAIVDFRSPETISESRRVYRNLVYRIAADGAILERMDLTLKGDGREGPEMDTQKLMLFALPSPAVLAIVEPLILKFSDRSLSYFAALTASVVKFWPSWLGVIALALFLGVMAWWRSAAFGLPRRERLAWLAFVFILGPPAFVGFWLARRWVIRLPCPACHVLAPRDRPDCVKCGTRFPDPALRGIEIFA